MKKQLLSVCLLLGSLYSQATVHPVTVADFQFNPSVVNAIVGDTITWTWVAGSVSHTTTCNPSINANTSLPAGAATWNSTMNSSTPTFSYVVTVAGTYNYLCLPHQSFMKAMLNVSAVLPVTLANFTVAPTQNNKALLKWTAAGETNVSYYSVQRSTDGSSFTEAGRIAASSDVSIQKNYTYTDNATPGSKFVYYSLKIVDRDGKTQLSPIAMFTNEAVKNRILISISPNPISSPGHLMMQFNADKPGTLLAQLFDMNGKLVKQTNMMATAGINNGHFHLGELPSGTYTLIVSIDGKRETKRLQFE